MPTKAAQGLSIYYWSFFLLAPHIDARVDFNIIDPDFKMHMRSSRKASHANLANDLTSYYCLSFFNKGWNIEVAIIGLEAIVMVNDYIVARYVIIGFSDDCATISRIDITEVIIKVLQVNGLMARIAAPAAGDEDSFDWPNEITGTNITIIALGTNGNDTLNWFQGHN